MKVTCWIRGSGGLYVQLAPQKFLREEAAGRVMGLGAEAHQARQAA